MKEIKIGIIGFDTSHVTAFTKHLNDVNDPYYVPGGKVVAGYPSFSPDLEASYSRVDGFTKELTETLRKNRTIDWQERDSARAKMRMMIKRLLKKHKYPPEGMEDAVQTVMTQCELWTDNNDMDAGVISYSERKNQYKDNTDQMVAENSAPYGDEEDKS